MKSSEFFVYGEATPEQRSFLQDVLSLGLAFVEGTERNGLVLRYADNDVLRGIIDEPLPTFGCTLNELYSCLREKVVRYSIAQSDQRYLAFPDSGNSVATLAADILCGFLNQNLIAVDRSAPSASFIELQLLLWLRHLIGFKSSTLSEISCLEEVGALWTPGGNMSNYTAVYVALQNRYPEVRNQGLSSLSPRPVIIQAREIAHFSYEGAARVLGLGSNGILWAKADGSYRTDPESVERLMQTLAPNVDPFMLVCVAGNCRTTCIDDILRLREVCDTHGLWLHVDACHGGSLLFSQRLKREFLQGIELADSVSLDPHKGLFITYPSSYILFRDPKSLSTLSRYPDRVSDPSCFDLGLITPFLGSRGFQSLKLWLLIKHLGVDGLGEVVENRCDVNRRLTSLLKDTGLFVLLNDNIFYRVAFVFCPRAVQHRIRNTRLHRRDRASMIDVVNEHTKKFCEQLYQSGEAVFDLFALEDINDNVGLGPGVKYSTIGMAIGHPCVSEDNENLLKRVVTRLGKRIECEMLAALDTKAKKLERSSPTRSTGPAGW